MFIKTWSSDSLDAFAASGGVRTGFVCGGDTVGKWVPFCEDGKGAQSGDLSRLSQTPEAPFPCHPTSLRFFREMFFKSPVLQAWSHLSPWQGHVNHIRPQRPEDSCVIVLCTHDYINANILNNLKMSL